MSKNNEDITRLNPVARAIIQGLYDTESPLHKLLGLHYVLKAIWKYVVDHWRSRIKIPETRGDGESLYFAEVRVDQSGYVMQESLVVQFPKPTDININMMPFVMARRFNETKLPKYLQSYWDKIIKHCIMYDEVGKIGYLTVHESYVNKGMSQRRPGIHTESPGVLMIKDGQGYLTPYVHWAFGRAMGGNTFFGCLNWLLLLKLTSIVPLSLFVF